MNQIRIFNMGVTLIILFLILCIISLPIALALIASAVGAVILSGRYPVEVVIHRMTGGLDSFVQ
jgi:hypothetical protein